VLIMALAAAALALMAWPARHPAERRLREMAATSRLSGAAGSGSRRSWRVGAPSRGWTFSVALAAGLLAAVWRGPAVGVAAAAVTAACLSGVTRAFGRAQARARDRDLSAALRLLRAELDVGASGPAALTAAGSVAGAYRPAFEACARAIADGDDLVAAASGVGGDSGHDMVMIAYAWQLATALGVPVAGVLARVDDDVQARRTQRRAVAAALAGPRSSGALLAGLPVLGVLLGVAMGARPLHILFDTPAGRLLLCAGVLLDGVGVAWTTGLISSAERS
jgi:tight adherence protein B